MTIIAGGSQEPAEARNQKLPPMTSSYEAWTWSHVPFGESGPPNRQMHESYLKRLDKFLMKVDDEPWKFSSDLQKARDPHQDPMIEVYF